MRRHPPLLLFLGLAACFVQDDPAAVLPDERIQVSLPQGNPQAKGEGDWAPWYRFTASTTEDINHLIGTVLFWVDSITTDHRPTWADSEANQAEWGPWSTALDPVETMLWVTYDPQADDHTWGFDQWPRDADRTAATTVILGLVDPGATHTRSSGRFEVDFDAIHALDPTEDRTGRFRVDYAIHDQGVTATATFESFGAQALDAAYTYDQTLDGEGRMDLLVLADVNPEAGTGLEERWHTRSRWRADGSGRADILVTGGDLGAETATITECWSASFEAVYHAESLTGDAQGDPALCAFDEAEYSAP